MGKPRKLTWTTCKVCGRLMPESLRRTTCSYMCRRIFVNNERRNSYRDAIGKPRRHTRPVKTGILNLLDK